MDILLFGIHKMAVYSFSQISMYKTCPRKYRYKYIDKIDEPATAWSPDLFLWTVVHSVLETLYKRLNEMQQPTLEEMLSRLDQERAERDENEIVLREWQTKESYYRRATTYLTEYWNTYAPFDDVRCVATEMMLTFSLDDAQQLKFRWVIDRLDKVWNSLIINDYKTWKSLPPEQKNSYQEQLTLYALGIQQQYWKYAQKIYGKLHYLHFDIVDEWEITDQTLNEVVEKYTDVVQEIEAKRFAHSMWTDDQFPAVENPSCQYCAYQSICPLWTHASMDDEILLGEKTVRSLVDEYAQVAKQATELDKQKKFLKEQLTIYAQTHNLEKLIGHEYVATLATQTNYTIVDHDSLTNALKQLWKDTELLRVDRFALARVIKDWSVLLWDLAWVDAKPSITLRTKKNKE
jgi:putative RecB family exonuclease